MSNQLLGRPTQTPTVVATNHHFKSVDGPKTMPRNRLQMNLNKPKIIIYLLIAMRLTRPAHPPFILRGKSVFNPNTRRSTHTNIIPNYRVADQLNHHHSCSWLRWPSRGLLRSLRAAFFNYSPRIGRNQILWKEREKKWVMNLLTEIGRRVVFMCAHFHLKQKEVRAQNNDFRMIFIIISPLTEKKINY